MKRFWTRAEAVPHPDGWAVALDGKIATTPARAPLATRHKALAGAVAGEWGDAPDVLRPEAMVLTGYLNAVIDRVAPNKAALASDAARFADHELICYRADGPQELIARQSTGWDPVAAWVHKRYGAKLATGAGVVHVVQPDKTLALLRGAVDALDAYRLAAALKLTGITKSLCLSLAVIEGEVDAAAAHGLSRIDEAFQAERWGEDAEAGRRASREREEMASVSAFLKLIT